MDLYLLLVTVSATIFTLLCSTIFFIVYGKFRVQENKIIASSSPPSPKSSLPRNWTPDVFPSFHGADVRKSFLSHFLKECRSKAISLFIDNEITRGEYIGPELKKAIQGSRIAIVLLSKRYASSSWCLDELVEIMKCKEELGQTVIPVFYKVDPTDVKKQAGEFGKVFKETCKGKRNEVIVKWSLALAKVATLAGYHSKNWDNEAKMVEDVATEVAKKDFDEFIGMEAHMNKISRVLRTDLDEVRMIGIWGPAGIGKTTIARCLFNQLSDTFQYSVFMMNVKTMYTPPVCSDDYTVKLHLQQKLLSQLTNQKEEDLKISHLGKPWPKKLGGLMFCMYAFGQKSPEDGFEMLVWQVTRLAGRLPLGLRVMGSYFRGMSKEEWENTLPGLRMCLDGEIESILMFSYNALSHENKDLFLHIACFFNYGWIEKVVEHLSKRFSDVRQQLNVLAEKSLIFLEIGRVSMHDMLVQLGGNIVRKQPTEPGQRQFLVDKREICEVLADGSAGSRSVIGIKFYGNKINVSERAFEGMSNLQFLRIRQERDGEGDTFHLFGGPSYLSRQLRLLDWKYFPMTCLHCIPNPELLVELIMFCSKLEKLWEGTKLLSNLKWVRLRDSKNLKDVSSLSTATSLQELDLTGCSSLEVPSSIGNATNLKHLNFSRCSSLVELPASIGNLHKLESLNLKKCCKLEVLPISPWIKRISRLRRLVLNGCKELLSLPQLPISLSELDAEDCESLERLDCSFLNQKIALNFANCFKLNKEARDIIIQTSTSYKGTVLPGKEMPNYFNYQANGGSLVMKLNERPSPSSVRWRACILLDCKDEVEAAKGQMLFVRQWIKQNSLDDVPCSPIMHILYRPLREHLYIFEFEANVTSNKLFFEFGVIRDTWMIKECGVHYLNTASNKNHYVVIIVI
ncbi:BnaA01g33750D [Brassica napus]|uniref:ADP-ribosyl cyclase/cyclic ADP-ribose hydrolase n=1 Tax=Brassica napus TaxID=3708 RepID=A0A078G6W2_BRANA|nr:BnaA01g33750D [Brassica napus]